MDLVLSGDASRHAANAGLGGRAHGGPGGQGSERANIRASIAKSEWLAAACVHSCFQPLGTFFYDAHCHWMDQNH